MKAAYEKWRELMSVARGNGKVERCFRNVRLVNPLVGEVREVDLAVHKGLVVGVGDYEASENIDCKGYYASAGFIDGHIHIESSLLVPERFAEAVVPWGTTTVVADPHEIANVCGTAGIKYFLEAANLIDIVDIFFMIPSCVPASPFETSGARLDAMDIYEFLDHPRVLGLAEVMNFPGVINGNKSLWEKIFLFDCKILDGHAPLVSGKSLNAYKMAGIRSDHESTRIDEAAEKLAAGFTIMIREGSQSKDMESLIGIVNNTTWPRCLFVSDDRHPDDLAMRGHMNVQVNRGMDLGLSPIMSITLATWTPALYFGFTDRGALIPGTWADFSLSPSLHPWIPERVFKKGEETARNGKLLRSSRQRAQKPKNPMVMKPLEPSVFALKAQGTTIRVIGLREGSIITDYLREKALIKGGFVVSDPARDIVKIAVCNRYKADVPPSIGFCKGLGIQKGALASTVAHDHHNLVVAGITDEAMAAAAEALRRSGGGLAVASSEKDVLVLPLEVGGLMTDAPVEEVASLVNQLKNKAKQIGSSLDNPFMALSFIALAVIPSLKITDKGLVDVDTFAFVPLFID